MEERKGCVHRVTRGQFGDAGDMSPLTGESALRTPHGLGEAGRSGGEDQEVEILFQHRSLGIGGRLRPHSVRVILAVDGEHQLVRYGGIDSVEQLSRLRVSDEQLAVRVTDEESELLAPIGRVDADDDRGGERGADEPEEVVGDVLKQDADVRRPPRPPQGIEERSAAAALLENLAIGPCPVTDQEPNTVVASPLTEHVGGGHHRVFTLGRPRPGHVASDANTSRQGDPPRVSKASESWTRVFMQLPGSSATALVMVAAG